MGGDPPRGLDAAIEEAIFSIAAAALAGSLDLWDDRVVATLGYAPVEAEPGVRLIGHSDADVRIVIERTRGKPGCTIRFATADTRSACERLYRRARQLGFTGVDGERAAPEPGFQLDTLVAPDGPIAILTIIRLDDPAAPAGVNIYPPPPGGEHAEV